MNLNIIFYVFIMDYFLIELFENSKFYMYNYAYKFKKKSSWISNKTNLPFFKIVFNNKLKFIAMNDRFIYAKNFSNEKSKTTFCFNQFKNLIAIDAGFNNKLKIVFNKNIINCVESNNKILFFDIFNIKYKIVLSDDCRFLLKNNAFLIYSNNYTKIQFFTNYCINNDNYNKTIDKNLMNIVNNIKIFDKKINNHNFLNSIIFNNIYQIENCIKTLIKHNLTNDLAFNFVINNLLSSNKLDLLKIYYLFFYLKIKINGRCVSFKNFSYNYNASISINNISYVLCKINNKKVIKINGVKYYNFDSIII